METIHGLGVHGPAIIGSGCAFTILAVLAVGLRIGSKRLAHSPFGLDGWLLVAALLLYVTAEILVIRSDILGREASSPEDTLYQTYLKYVYIYSVFYFLVVALVQISILFFYRRIFIPTSFHLTSGILIAICICWCITALVIEIGYPGHPIGYFFPGSAETNFNVVYENFWLAMAIIETLLEVIILILPIRELYQLQLSLKKKLLCSLIFALGGFVIITGIIRIVKVYQPSGKDIDLTQGDIWLNVHLGVAIICACLPTYRPLISRNPWLRLHGKQSENASESSDMTPTIGSAPKRVYHSDANEMTSGLYTGPNPDLHGHFANARRSESTNATKFGSGDESPVRTGEAVRIKQTIDVV
ncbi:MAG: hypothetical protein Q9213_003026 [Squamulea squamosa]